MLPQQFQDQLKAATAEAIDAGLTYNRDVNSFVLERVGLFDPAKEHLIGTVDRLEGDTFESWQQKMATAEAQVVNAPRGHYVLLNHNSNPNGSFTALFSTGLGVAVGGHHDYHPTPPAWKDLWRRAVEYEIYIHRQTIEADRELAADLEAIETAGLEEGREIRNVSINGANYSTLTITAVNAKNGMVDLSLVKRGSSRRYARSIRASNLAKIADLEPAPSFSP